MKNCNFRISQIFHVKSFLLFHLTTTPDKCLMQSLNEVIMQKEQLNAIQLLHIHLKGNHLNYFIICNFLVLANNIFKIHNVKINSVVNHCEKKTVEIVKHTITIIQINASKFNEWIETTLTSESFIFLTYWIYKFLNATQS